MSSRILILSIFLSVSCSLAADDSFKNFRIPDHRVSSLTGYANLYGTFSKSEAHEVNIRREMDGDIEGIYYWLHDSDRFRNVVRASLSLSRVYQYTRHEESFDEWTEDHSDGFDQRIIVSWEPRFYPWTLPVGCSANLYGSLLTSESWGLYEQSWLTPDSVAASSDGNSIRSWIGNVSSIFTIGYGRVRDATAIFDVYILEERLIATGALSGKLQPETRRDIAAIFYARTDYERRYEREDKYFWQEVEALLKKDPAFLPDRFDAYSVHRIAESIDGNRLLRQQGFFFGPTLYAYHSHQYQRHTPNHAQYSIDEQMRDYVRWGVRGEYYSTLSRSWQFDLSGEIEWERKPVNDGYNLDLSAVATYIIADRWRYTADLSLYRLASRHDSHYSDWWGTDIRNELRYFVEDRVALEGIVDHYFGRSYNGYDEASGISSSSNTEFSIGLSYLLQGVQSTAKNTKPSVRRGRTRPAITK